MEISAFPLRSLCLNTDFFLLDLLCPVHIVVSCEDGLAFLASFCCNVPFALSHAIEDSPMSLASKVGRCGMSHMHLTPTLCRALVLCSISFWSHRSQHRAATVASNKGWWDSSTKIVGEEQEKAKAEVFVRDSEV